MESIEMAAQMEQAVKQFNEALERLRPAFEAMMEAIQEGVRVIVEHIERICELVRRWLFYAELIRWHLPHRIARFIAIYWPTRWLSTLPRPTAKE